MDNDHETEVIKFAINETRVPLKEKLRALEQQIVDIVQGATTAVEKVKEAVQETVETVKGSVHQTVDSVNRTFDLQRQVHEHPWLFAGGSVVLGYMAGCFLARGGLYRRATGAMAARTSMVAVRGQNGRPGGYHSEVAPAAPPQPSESGWLSHLGGLLEAEVRKLKRVAIGTVLSVVRDLVSESMPAEIKLRLEEVANNITVKLGGDPIRGPVLPGLFPAHPGTVTERVERRFASAE
jgi:ElaB/YqjD/DUF883 family membrane-anchored ribosome-binding protein